MDFLKTCDLWYDFCTPTGGPHWGLYVLQNLDLFFLIRHIFVDKEGWEDLRGVQEIEYEYDQNGINGNQKELMNYFNVIFQ